jgi:hypothetical protein
MVSDPRKKDRKGASVGRTELALRPASLIIGSDPSDSHAYLNGIGYNGYRT